MDTQVVMDADLKKVCEFMQRNIAADRLVSVAENVGALWSLHSDPPAD